jgi:hypothetical protein
VIDFRYFLVAMTGVFLALAVGVALGAGPFRGDLDQELRSDLRQVDREKNDLRGRISQLQQVNRYRDAFAEDLAPNLVSGRLSGQKVVVVALPGADSAIEQDVVSIVAAAGSKVTGTVRVKPKWVDPDERQFLEDLAVRLAGRQAHSVAAGSTYEQAGSVLAHALVTEDAKAAGRTDAATATVLGAFGEGGLVDAPQGLARASLAVVVAPPAPTASRRTQSVDEVSNDPSSDTPANAAWVALARSIDDAGRGVVMAGETSAAVGDEGVLASLRQDSRASAAVSSVDVANLPSGQVAIVWALVEQRRGGSGHYGAVGTTDGALPDVPGGSGS